MSISAPRRPTWCEIDLDALAFNFHSVKNFVGADHRFMAIVKADAYGHGAVPCALRLEREGVDWFGVALPEEGVELRAAGVKKPVLCLGSFWRNQEKLILDNDLTPVIYQFERAFALDRAARERGLIARVHVKIDTGMGRIGVRFDAAEELAARLAGLPNIEVEGLMSHFAAADDPAERDFTETQMKRFRDCVAIFEKKGFKLKYKDLANSPGAVVYPEARANMVRIGGILYGLGDDVLPAGVARPALRPVLALRSRVSHLKMVPRGETLGYSRTFTTGRDSLIATVPIGYEDGLPRALSNKARFLIGGRFAPVVGRISMDWTIVDVTDIPQVKLEDEVIIIGADNDLQIKAEELALSSGTISYEITCGINRRVDRIYVGS